MHNTLGAAVLALSLAAGAAAAAAADAPPMGLYTCTEPSGYPDMTSMFGILDSSTYANVEGKKGHYRYDAASGTVSMGDGPLAGKSYRRIPGANSYLMLNCSPALACPHSPRDPRRYPW